MKINSESVYTILQKAKPTWSAAELCKIHAKLRKVNVTDVDVLEQVVSDGRLNRMLSTAGERQLKASTLQQLRYVLRPRNREPFGDLVASSLPQQNRRCYCSGCLIDEECCEPQSFKGGEQSSEMGGEPRLQNKPRVTVTSPPENTLRRAVSAADYRSALQKAGGRIAASSSSAAASSPQLKDGLRRAESVPGLLPHNEGTLLGRRPLGHSYSFGPADVQRVPQKPPPERVGGFPVVPGGMRHNDDTLDTLLRKARGCMVSGRVPEAAPGPSMSDMDLAGEAMSEDLNLQAAQPRRLRLRRDIVEEDSEGEENACDEVRFIASACADDLAVSHGRVRPGAEVILDFANEDTPSSPYMPASSSEATLASAGLPLGSFAPVAPPPESLTSETASHSQAASGVGRLGALRRVRTPIGGSPIYVPSAVGRRSGNNRGRERRTRLTKVYAADFAAPGAGFVATGPPRVRA